MEILTNPECSFCTILREAYCEGRRYAFGSAYRPTPALGRAQGTLSQERVFLYLAFQHPVHKFHVQPFPDPLCQLVVLPLFIGFRVEGLGF